LALPGKAAIVQVVTQSTTDQPALRQTRFYQQTAEGWQRTQPDDELWGSPRRLELGHFSFQYRQNDAQVVTAVAPQIDALYTTLLHNFGLTPNAERLVIEVSVEHVTGAILTPQWAHEPLVVPSPSVYLAPVELSDSAILAQSIALPLIEYMGERAIEDHAIPPRWRPLLLGLRLWQLWDSDMPLARWRHDVVMSLYMEVPTENPGPQYAQSEPYPELCAMHSLWLLSPVMVEIPLECRISNEGTWVARWLTHRPHTHFDQLSTPRKGGDQYYDEGDYYFGPTEVVAMATLLEYTVATYGYEQLPVLLVGLARDDAWDTLLPAVYGLSSSEFEKGWQAYLVEEYGLELNLLRP
jgi:hypothetical protein